MVANTRRTASQTLKSIPTTYRGTIFRSRLEAQWAATFDSLGWYWEYEPAAVDLGHGVRYLCDFHLPTQHAWVEVKGPFASRLDKTNRLHKELAGRDLVIIARPAGPGGLANWHGVDTTNVGIFTCGSCHQSCFLNPLNRAGRADWRCRCCNTTGGLDPLSRIDPSATIEANRRDRGRAVTDALLAGLPLANVTKGAA